MVTDTVKVAAPLQELCQAGDVLCSNKKFTFFPIIQNPDNIDFEPVKNLVSSSGSIAIGFTLDRPVIGNDISAFEIHLPSGAPGYVIYNSFDSCERKVELVKLLDKAGYFN